MDFQQKFEPKGNKIIHGAGQSFETFSNYWDTLEKNKPFIYMTYAKIQKIPKWIEKIKEETKAFPNIILQIGLKLLDADGNDETFNILRGKYDKELVEFFKFIKEFNNPVFIRIGYEFDKKGKYNPKSFVGAWKHIVEKFRELRVENIATVWCACPFNGTESVEQFYPGERYVDWFGIDVFYAKHLTGNYKPVEEFLELAEKYKKPVMIGEATAAEVGVLNGKVSWERWFDPYFKWIHSHPIIKAFCYINWDWKKDKTWGSEGTWGNCRIEDNEIVRELFVNELKNPKYVHNQKIEDFLKKVYS